MFDYIELIPRVRRGVHDLSVTYIDKQDSTENDSYFVVLSNDGYATIHPSGAIINGIVIDESGYTVDRNLIHFDTLIPADSQVVIHYDMVQNTDEMLADAIDDSIHLLVEPIFNIDFEFGVDTPSRTITNQDVDKDLQALFVHGAVMTTMGIYVSEASGDAIYIKDGDTVIDTAASSREAARGYQPVIDKWNQLLEIVRINRFGGFTMY